MKMKKVTQKDRYGNQISYEFEADTKQFDPNALLKNMMEGGGVPEMSAPPIMGEEFNMGHAPTHPGSPKGEDTIPAWLTPGEFVVNAEATEMFGPQIEAMNEVGRMAKGGHVPMYRNDGGYTTVRDWDATEDLLDSLRQVESGGGKYLLSPAGAEGPYQILPKVQKNPGYGIAPVKDPYDEEESRHFARQYLDAIQARNPDWTKEDVLRAYNWGEAATRQGKAGTREMPKEAAEYPHKVLRELSRRKGHEAYFNTGDYVRGGRYAPEGGLPGAPVADPGFADPGVQQIHDDAQADLTAMSQPVPPMMEVPDEESTVTFGGQDISANEAETQVDYNKQKQFDTILNAVQMGQLDPDQAREAVKGMGSNWVGKFDAESRVSGVGESAGLAGTVGELSGDVAHNTREALGIEEPIQSFKDDLRQITTGEKTVPRINAPQVATVETNPELNQEAAAAQEATTVEQAVAETDADPQAKADSEAIDKVDNTTQKAAGEEAAANNPQALESVKSAFGQAFGNLFSGPKLAEAAIMYLGSRALGYSHGGSLNWAAKNYLGGVQAQNKEIKELHKSGKYTRESIDEYKKTGDAGALIAKAVAPKRIGAQPETYYDAKGRKINAYEYQDGAGNKFLGASINGQVVDLSQGDNLGKLGLHQDEYKVKGTKAYQQRINDYRKISTDQIKSLRSQFGQVGQTKDGTAIYATDVNPATAAGETAKWAAKNNVAPEDLAGLVESAYHDMLNDKRQDGKKARDIVPYLNQLVVRKEVGNPDIFTRKDYDPKKGGPQYIPAQSLARVNQVIEGRMKAAGHTGNVKQVADQYYNSKLDEWLALPQDARDKFEADANKQHNGFYVFVAEDLGVPVIAD